MKVDLERAAERMIETLGKECVFSTTFKDPTLKAIQRKALWIASPEYARKGNTQVKL